MIAPLVSFCEVCKKDIPIKRIVNSYLGNTKTMELDLDCGHHKENSCVVENKFYSKK